MTIPVSHVKAAKAALYAAVTATINDTTVDVVYDTPTTYLPDDIVAVGKVSRRVEDFAMVGSYGTPGSLAETFTIDVTVSVFRGGDQAQVVFERFCDLVDGVVAAVRQDPTLAGSVLEAVPLSDIEYPEADWSRDDSGEPDGKGRICESVIPIVCHAVI